MIDKLIAFIFGMMVGAGVSILLIALMMAGEDDHDRPR